MTIKFPFTDPNTGIVYLSRPSSHGEVTFVQIESFPDSVGNSIPLESGRHILGHSESGHHHVLDRVENIERYYDTSSPDISDANISAPVRSFLRVIQDDVKLEHMKAKGTHHHGEQVLPVGNYLVTTGVQYTPEGMRRVSD